MPVYRLLLAYDGRDFHGWQRQPRLRTVQGELEKALSTVTRASVMVQGAGRTDAGVHALGQCASFHVDAALNTYSLLSSLRAVLPEDISPYELVLAADSFNARFSAKGRQYRYRMALRPCAPLRRLRWELPYRVEIDVMRRALDELRGAVDWRGFCTAIGAAKGSICHLRRLELEEEGDELRLCIGADRFLHKMVRIITGTLVEIGRGRFGPGHMTRILETGDRSLAGPTAPPQGLFLERVEYDAADLAPPD